ncbi:uncharacterized protein HMPREF1541_04611 [Cyphellophora europaea CBS 101466]|uniref:Transcription initiation factor TFIID subunit 13 n=1 Tax=Cyphellophora europaea (strain CBS 101466) TaxID=1220924 RepID=W2RVJ7_CYPE1|nr:uncharacterized protein HMPREF1541_04611 [Cyphellophora europaea CBS 101466]ETN40335.1 hypothetical protein HMPREF1541_04611 [Cyphellophora europaea CBS 101466]
MAPNDTVTMNPNQVNKFPYLKAHQFPGPYVRPLKKHKAMEYRARAGKHHGTLNFGKDLENALYAYGNPAHPDISDPHADSLTYLNRLPTPNHSHRPHPFHSSGKDAEKNGHQQPFPETLRVLDEIVTDFIIEVCHEAVDHATFEGRHKVNPQDITFVFRNDKAMLGRMRAMSSKSRVIKEQRKMADDKPMGEKMTVDQLMELGEAAGEEGTGKGKGRGKGRRKRKAQDVDDAPSPAGGVSDGGSEDGDGATRDGEEPLAKRARSENAS